MPTEKGYPFQPSKLYYKVLPNGDRVQRKWLSYSEDLNKLFCASCMVFSPKSKSNSPYVSGYAVSAKHVYDSVDCHEKSKEHLTATTAAAQSVSGKTVEDLISKNLREIHSVEVEERRKILRRIIDVIIFLRRRGLAFRGKFESAYLLSTATATGKNIGNFLSLVLLVGKYDSILQDHIQKCELLSAKRKMKHKDSKGRGSLITFLSESTVNNKLITIVGNAVQAHVVNVLKKCGQFSLMVDSTQDKSVVDQFAICVRYVEDGKKAVERLLHLLDIHDASGEGLYKSIDELFKQFELEMRNIIGCSFDGAANMKGEFNGLKAKFASAIYTHCQAHVLNLVMGDTISACLKAEILFGLVQQGADFLSDSYKRMDVWKDHISTQYGHEKLRRLSKIGATRWWSKDKALTSVFELPEKVSKIETCRFIIFLTFLWNIVSTSSKFDCQTKFQTRSLIQNWTKFENIFTAVIILDLFSVTTPVSKYLQSPSLDYLRAWKMVETLSTQISSKRTEEHFSKLYASTKEFVKKCSEFFANTESGEMETDDPGDGVDELETIVPAIEIEIEEDFPVKRISRRKKVSDEKASDERSSDPCSNFRREVFYNILDNARESINTRFVPNKDLYRDRTWLDPNKFCEIAQMEVADFKEETFQKLSELTGLDRIFLLEELLQLAKQYENLTKHWREIYNATNSLEKEKTNEDDDKLKDEDEDEKFKF